jgi:hypothetical protein
VYILGGQTGRRHVLGQGKTIGQCQRCAGRQRARDKTTAGKAGIDRFF